MNTIRLDKQQGGAVAFNPISSCSEVELSRFLFAMCVGNEIDNAGIRDQIEALVPAVIELRDRFGLELNMLTLSNYGTVAGFGELARDVRLSDLTRARCKAIYARLLVQGIKLLFGPTHA
jgi:hypothetical protein